MASKAIKQDGSILPINLNNDDSEDIQMEEDVKEALEQDVKKITLEDLPGVGPATVEKLNTVGYTDLMGIAVATPGELIDATGMSQAAAKKLIAAARANLDMGFISGEDVLKKRALVMKISTGSRTFDDLLAGGFETGAITECFGEWGSGKCVDKSTKVLYFNDETAHLQSIADVYEKYAKVHGEKDYEDGKIIEVPTVKVLGLTKDGIKKTKAQFLFKQYVKKLYEVKTKRGRTMKITGPHKLLTFEKGLVWKPSGALQSGALIAYPKKLDFPTVSDISEDDAYFLGMFCAEGTSNPLSISTESDAIKDWLVNYVQNSHGYEPTVRVDNRRENAVYTILFRTKTKEFLDELSKSDSSTKFVPESVLSSANNITQQFLAGYMDGDGSFEKSSASATTKSNELASGLSYLFLKLGMPSTMAERIVDNKIFHVVHIVGEERDLINDLPCKIKNPTYASKNSAYGYSKEVVEYLRDVYRKTLGGNRGNKEKVAGRKNNDADTFYHYLTGSDYINQNMNQKTFQKIREVFYDGFVGLQNSLSMVERIETLNQDEHKELIDSLPFAFNSIGDGLGLSKSAVQNYVERGMPESRSEEIKQTLLVKLTERANILEAALKTIKNINILHFDEVTSITEVDYDDYVYDFVVPEGHSFVGGSNPTIMHNTQIGHMLSVNIQKEDPDAVAVYIDTENTFRPERIKQLAEGIGLDSEKVLKNIMVARAFNSDHQMLLVEKVEDLIKKQGKKVKLVVVDSLTAHFRAEFVGRGTLAERQQKLNKHMHMLLKVADANNVCVYVTNQVMSKPDQFFGDPTSAIGGHVVGHASTFRIYLRKGRKGSRVAKLIDSPNLAEGEANFIVTQEGLKDI